MALRLRLTLSFILTTLLVSFIVKFGINAIKKSNQSKVVSQLCSVIQPRLQVGGVRTAYEFLDASLMAAQDLGSFHLKVVEGTQEYSRSVAQFKSSREVTCMIGGREDIKIAVSFEADRYFNRQMIWVLGIVTAILAALCGLVLWILQISQSSFSYALDQAIQKKLSGNCNSAIPGGLADSLVSRVRVISEIGAKIDSLECALREKEVLLQDQKSRVALDAMARQVSHDIRSPLSALNMVVCSLKELPEDKRLIIRNAAQRINDIANALLNQGKQTFLAQKPAADDIGGAMTQETVMLVALLDTILSEKRIQFREKMDVEILGELERGYGLFAKLNTTEFSRVISNLINNSVEAFSGPGRVTVAIRECDEGISLVIRDNGKGIPPEVLSRLGTKGVSHGKEGTQSGSGLGVFHAKETVEGAGGRFAIQSTVGSGTAIMMTLPRAETPKWFVKQIELKPGTVVVSVDDDQTIHQIWSGRIRSANPLSTTAEHLAFSSTAQFEAWFRSGNRTPALFLVDYEFLGQSTNGLGLIERLEIGDRAILVTSRYDERHIREKATSLGLRLLPKGLAPFVPLIVMRPAEKFDVT